MSETNESEAPGFEEVYQAFHAVLEEHGEAEALEPAASDEQIKRAEEELELTLPPSFKAFLRKHNGGSAHDTSLYGVSTDDGYDLAVLNLRGRREGLPEHLLGFAATPNSDVWCFDFSKAREDGEAPISLIDVHQGQVIPACDTFLDWLKRLETLEAELSEKRGPQPMTVEEWEAFIDRERAKLRRLSKTPAREMRMPDPEEVRADLAGKIPVDPRHLKPRN